MATRVPQRALRNETGALLRRVEAGERLRITIHGHPIADLVPVEELVRFVPREAVVAGLAGLLDADDPLDRDLRETAGDAVDPFGA
jgi:prevent-host-death family protein